MSRVNPELDKPFIISSNLPEFPISLSLVDKIARSNVFIVDDLNNTSSKLPLVPILDLSLPFFNTFNPELEYDLKHSLNLNELYINRLGRTTDWFEVLTMQILMSSLVKSNSLLSSCITIISRFKDQIGNREVVYLASPTESVDLDSFLKENIIVKFQEFRHFGPEQTDLDLLLKYGEDAKYYLWSQPASQCLRNCLVKIGWRPEWATLEAFASDGTGHLQVYSGIAQNLEMWEYDYEKQCCLYRDIHNGHSKCCNTLKEINETDHKFKLVILDPPATMGYNGLVPNVERILEDEAYTILRAIKTPFKPNPDVKVTEPIEYFKDLFSKDFNVIDSWEEVREYYFNIHWLSNYVFKLQRKPRS